jgi:hypothetical protein
MIGEYGDNLEIFHCFCNEVNNHDLEVATFKSENGKK